MFSSLSLFHFIVYLLQCFFCFTVRYEKFAHLPNKNKKKTIRSKSQQEKLHFFSLHLLQRLIQENSFLPLFVTTILKIISFYKKYKGHFHANCWKKFAWKVCPSTFLVYSLVIWNKNLWARLLIKTFQKFKPTDVKLICLSR